MRPKHFRHIVLAFQVALLSCGLACSSSHVAMPPTTEQVVFLDEFSSSKLGATWVALNRQGDTGVGEQQCYSPSQVTVSGGNLVITSAVQSAVCGDQDNPPSMFPYVSGMVQWSSLSFTYGTVEFRARMAGGQGTWPAVWLLGAECQGSNKVSAQNTGCNWPQPGADEIDIAEIKNGDLATVWQNVASGDGGFQSCTPTTTDTSQSFHTFQLVWAPDSLTWKIDGVETCQFRTHVPSNPMFLIINTAVGGGGGATDPGTLPQTMVVDYIKITKYNP